MEKLDKPEFRKPCIDKCKGCTRIITVTPDVKEDYCGVYYMPAAQWRRGDCPMATHLQKQVVEQKKVNPLKQSKRGGK